jgi:ectoine hydroxylase-related dioxygenase (phytanoyl-CoA dioxygenase family)
MNISFQNLTEQQTSLLPTEEDITFYEEHGWYISKKVVPDEILEQSIEASERYFQGERDFQIPINSGFKDWKPGDTEIIRNCEFVSLQSLQLRKLARLPIIGAIAARLTRSKSVRLLDDQIISKPPVKEFETTTIGWHVDKAYWSTCSSDHLLTAWIPMRDCDESCGPLMILDRSHHWPRPELQESRYFNFPNHKEFEQEFVNRGRQVVKVPMAMKKGQMSFHHCWAVHGSAPNHSQVDRLAMAIHIQDEANKYRAFWDKNGNPVHICDDNLCQKLPNGNPDYRDPDIFPMLWPVDERR